MSMAPILPANNDIWEEVSDDEVSSGDVEPPPIILNNDSDASSNSDEEVPLPSGYELLPQEPDNDENQGSFETEDEDITVTLSNSEMGDSEDVPVPTVHSLFTQALAVAAAPAPERITTEIAPVSEEQNDANPMDSEQIEKIKSAMAGFTLPSSSFPDWAVLIPEDEWKVQLVARLQHKKGTPQGSLQDTASGRDQNAKSPNSQELPVCSKVASLNRTFPSESIPKSEADSHPAVHTYSPHVENDKSD